MAHQCRRCESLPEDYPDSGTLYLVPPITPLAESLKRYLRERSIGWTEPHPDVYAIPLGPSLLESFCREFFCTLGAAELKDCKSLILSEDRTPSIQELVQMQPLATLMARIQGQWLLEVLRDKRITTHFQPIVTCGELAVHGHECLLRGLDGQGGTIPPGAMFTIAREADLLFHLDRVARLSAIACSTRQGLQGKLFINFNPTSIYAPTHCLQTTLAAIREAAIAPADIVFEVVESDTVQDVAHLTDLLDFYRNEGFKVALDDLGAGYGSLNLLNRLRPDYLKLDMDLVRGVDQDPYKARIAGNLLDLAAKLDVKSIAEGVETVEEYRWCRDNGAAYVQGYLFGKPAGTPLYEKFHDNLLDNSPPPI